MSTIPYHREATYVWSFPKGSRSSSEISKMRLSIPGPGNYNANYMHVHKKSPAYG